MNTQKSNYDSDFHQWSLDQASLIKNRNFLRLDIDNLIEEIEGLGASDKRALKSYLAILLSHLLKIQYQPEKHTRSWDLSIKSSKNETKEILRYNPSLKRLLPDFLKDAYMKAKLEAAYQTGLDEKIFPEECPWKIEEVLGEKNE